MVKISACLSCNLKFLLKKLVSFLELTYVILKLYSFVICFAFWLFFHSWSLRPTVEIRTISFDTLSKQILSAPSNSFDVFLKIAQIKMLTLERVVHIILLIRGHFLINMSIFSINLLFEGILNLFLNFL